MNILVYADEGVSSLSLQETLATFQGVSTSIAPIGYQKLIDTDWEKTTDLLIIPGGRDIPYHSRLKGKGIEKIRKFVEEGGSFLGICAGAYFACDEVIFEKDTPLEVHESRDLKFFPGAAMGTLYLHRSFAYNSETGSHASAVTYETAHLHLYYNGGCTFHDAEKYPSVTIVARYQDADNQPAIIHCKVGKGSVLLSGVHFEVGFKPLKKEGCRDEIVQKLHASEDKRKKLISSLLKYL